MQKKAVNWTIDNDLVEFISDLKEKIGIPSQSKAAELLLDIARDYLSDEQIRMEYSARGVRDNRKKPRG